MKHELAGLPKVNTSSHYNCWGRQDTGYEKLGRGISQIMSGSEKSQLSLLGGKNTTNKTTSCLIIWYLDIITQRILYLNDFNNGDGIDPDPA